MYCRGGQCGCICRRECPQRAPDGGHRQHRYGPLDRSVCKVAARDGWQAQRRRRVLRETLDVGREQLE